MGQKREGIKTVLIAFLITLVVIGCAVLGVRHRIAKAHEEGYQQALEDAGIAPVTVDLGEGGTLESGTLLTAVQSAKELIAYKYHYESVADYQKEKKFFGKTGDEWRTYFSYTWYKYLIGLILIILAGNILHAVITNKGYDSGVVSIGHFETTTDYVENFMTTRLGYENPLVSTVDMVVPNDQGQSQQAYADQTASTLLLSGPNVLVFDEVTMPYYFGSLQDVTRFIHS